MTEPDQKASGPVLREFLSYLRHPQLTAPSGLRSLAAWRGLGLLALLQLAVMLCVILPLVMGWSSMFDLTGPSAFDAVPQGLLLPLTVVVAPLGEELLFRGWLSGRLRALWLLLCAAAALAVLLKMGGGAASPIMLLALGGALIAAPIGWFLLRRRLDPPRWFKAAFPAIFYLVVAGFALMHLTNYAAVSALMIPLVLPQAWIGLMLGYIRMRIGLTGAILTHMLSNAVMLALGPLFG